MDECVLGRLIRVDFDDMSCMGGVRRRCLETLAAHRAMNQQSFTILELMETLEEMYSSYWNPLLDSTVGTSVENFLKPTKHRSPWIGLPAQGVGLKRQVGGFKMLSDLLVAAEDFAYQLHRSSTEATQQRIDSLSRKTALAPG